MAQKQGATMGDSDSVATWPNKGILGYLAGIMSLGVLIILGTIAAQNGDGVEGSVRTSDSEQASGEPTEAPTGLECSNLCQHNWIGDESCDIDCFTEECGFDGGDCLRVPDPVACAAAGCLTWLLGNGVCMLECNIEECAYDLGDCIDTPTSNSLTQVPLTCPTICEGWIGDGECDATCFLPECNYDLNDCDHIPDPIGCQAAGCNTFLIGNGDCDNRCDTEECAFSLGDCVPDLCSPTGCESEIRGDRVCDQICMNELCEFDGGDCDVRNHQNVTNASGCQNNGCNLARIGDSVCDYACYSEECEFDHGDCDGVSETCVLDTYCATEFLRDGFCDYACNNPECNFDFGDCL